MARGTVARPRKRAKEGDTIIDLGSRTGDTVLEVEPLLATDDALYLLVTVRGGLDALLAILGRQVSL